MAEIKKYEYKLDMLAISEIIEAVDAYLTRKKTDGKLQTLLLLESILLDIHSHYDSQITVKVSILQRFGHNSIRVKYKGKEFNPTGTESAPLQTNMFLNLWGLTPSYSYDHNINELTIAIPRRRLTSEHALFLAIVLAFLAGLIRPVIPEAAVSFISNYILSTISGIFLDLLGGFAGFMILFSILSGICGMGTLADLSKKGKYLLSRTLISSAIGTIISSIILIPFFTFSYGKSSGNDSFQDLFQIVRGIIPPNPVTPFIEGNMLQICLIALIIGVAILFLGNKAERINALVVEGNTLFFCIIDFICRFLPLYIFADLTNLFWSNGLEIVLNVWKPIILCIVSSSILIVYSVTYVSIKYKVSLPMLVKKIYPSFIIALSTASSLAAFGTAQNINKKKLGIDSSYSMLATPIKNQILALPGSNGIIILIYYLAEYSGINVNPVWFVVVWLLSFLTELAIPPIPGGVVIFAGILLNQFEIDSSCLGMTATLLLVFDFFLTASRVVLAHMEEVLEADKLGILNMDILRKS